MSPVCNDIAQINRYAVNGMACNRKNLLRF
jgi:hypothetical protein